MVAFAKPHLKPHTRCGSAKDSGHRFYSAEISRWLSRDPIGEWGGLNVYGFVRNNPIDDLDLIGLSVWYEVKWDGAWMAVPSQASIEHLPGTLGCNGCRCCFRRNRKKVGYEETTSIQPVGWIVEPETVEVEDTEGIPWQLIASGDEGEYNIPPYWDQLLSGGGWLYNEGGGWYLFIPGIPEYGEVTSTSQISSVPLSPAVWKPFLPHKNADGSWGPQKEVWDEQGNQAYCAMACDEFFEEGFLPVVNWEADSFSGMLPIGGTQP